MVAIIAMLVLVIWREATAAKLVASRLYFFRRCCMHLRIKAGLNQEGSIIVSKIASLADRLRRLVCLGASLEMSITGLLSVKRFCSTRANSRSASSGVL